ncbi:hypothetical protein HZ994_14710 [Akkermansiaceae bacterium]|nr:hypothetical protein HZ994_14710 [Akkermansiaceae bacterium]
MKLHTEDPRLTAYILGELPPEEALAVEHAVAGDPSLRMVVAEAEKAQSQLTGLLGGGRDTLLPRQRDNIRRAAKEAARNGKVVQLGSHRKARKSWVVPFAAAAAIAAGIFILTKIPATKGGGKGVSGNSANNAAPPSAMPDAVPRDGTAGAIRLPLRAGKESLAKISSAVRIASRKPSADEVSVPEMLNAFPLRANAAVALKGGCKLGAEIIPCPWKPSGSLILIEVRGAKDGERSLSVEYKADAGSVISHKLLGYPPASGSAANPAASRMSPNSTMLLVLEVNSRSENLGRLAWSVDGSPAPSIPLLRNPEQEPSDDARFAALVCGFGLWLRGEDAASLDETMVLGLAREVAADGLVPDRYDFLDLVDQAVKLE